MVRDKGRADMYEAAIDFAKTLPASGPATDEEVEEFVVLRKKYHDTQMNMRATLVSHNKQSSAASAFTAEYYGNKKG